MRRPTLKWPVGLAALLISAMPGATLAQTTTTGPSAFCHIVDGVFSDCGPDPMNAIEEWSDISGVPFFVPSIGALNVVYTEMNSTQTEFHLMYDWTARTVPIGNTESATIHFDTLEEGVLEHYEVRIFGDDTFEVFVDGVLSGGTEGITAAVGFGASANEGMPHAQIELQIPMTVVYSPDVALFWSGSFPPNPKPVDPNQPTTCPDGSRPIECPRETPDQPGGLCCPSEPVTASSSVVFTDSETGRTTVAALPLQPFDPSLLCVRPSGGLLDPLVDTAVPPTASYDSHGDYVNEVARFVELMLAGLAANQIIALEDIEGLQSCLVNPRARSNVGQ